MEQSRSNAGIGCGFPLFPDDKYDLWQIVLIEDEEISIGFPNLWKTNVYLIIALLPLSFSLPLSSFHNTLPSSFRWLNCNQMGLLFLPCILIPSLLSKENFPTPAFSLSSTLFSLFFLLRPFSITYVSSRAFLPPIVTFLSLTMLSVFSFMFFRFFFFPFILFAVLFSPLFF